MRICNHPKQTLAILSFSLLLLSQHALAQFPEKLKNGLRYYLDKTDSSRFIALNMVGQFWIRNNQNNPYTTVAGTAESSTTDMSIRCIRFVLSGALTDR